MFCFFPLWPRLMLFCLVHRSVKIFNNWIWVGVQKKASHIRARIVAHRVSGGFGDSDHPKINVCVQNTFLVLRQGFNQGPAVRAKDH